MRWWRFALGGALLAWVLGTAYYQARRRGRSIGLAILLFASAAVAFVTASLYPWPARIPPAYPSALIVASIALLALSMAVILWRGFRR